MKRSKRYKELAAKVPETPVDLPKAVELLKSFEGTKFDQTIEIHMHLGIDPKQADQIIRGSIVLPHGIGKTQRVVVFAKGAAADAAREAGLRRLHCFTRHDGRCRTAWPSPWSSKLDAFASSRNRHAGCGQGRFGIQGR